MSAYLLNLDTHYHGVGIIVAAFNEAPDIADVIADFRAVLDRVACVDAGSHDDTAAARRGRRTPHSFLSHLAGPWCQEGVTTTTAKEFTMNARVNMIGNPVGAKFWKYIVSAGKVVTDSTLPAATQNLVKIRASQINGCAGCLDMHTKEAAHAGETSTRLNLIAAWREATVFTDAERAALELTEQGTRIADAAGGVTDEVWANAAKHYDDDQLAALVSLIALINAFNRGNVIVQQPAGDYQPGQFE